MRPALLRANGDIGSEVDAATLARHTSFASDNGHSTMHRVAIWLLVEEFMRSLRMRQYLVPQGFGLDSHIGIIQDCKLVLASIVFNAFVRRYLHDGNYMRNFLVLPGVGAFPDLVPATPCAVIAE